MCLSNHKGPWVITLQINKAWILIFGIFLLEMMKKPRVDVLGRVFSLLNVFVVENEVNGIFG